LFAQRLSCRKVPSINVNLATVHNYLERRERPPDLPFPRIWTPLR